MWYYERRYKEGVCISANNKKEDSRIIKTEQALCNSLFTLLRRQRFGKITVRDICEEAFVSRAAFYAHFTDKYDLLKFSLTQIKLKNTNGDITYEHMEKAINDFVHKNESVIKNIVHDANSETLDILFAAMLSTLNIAFEESRDGSKISPKYTVLSNIYAGGMVYYFLWLVKNNFPADVEPMNAFLYEIILKFKEWSSK